MRLEGGVQLNKGASLNLMRKRNFRSLLTFGSAISKDFFMDNEGGSLKTELPSSFRSCRECARTVEIESLRSTDFNTFKCTLRRPNDELLLYNDKQILKQ